MVTKFGIRGAPYNEPPYTESEQMELYRRMSGGPSTTSWRVGYSA